MKTTIIDGELFFKYDGKTYSPIDLLAELNKARAELESELSAARHNRDILNRQYKSSLVHGLYFDRTQLKTVMAGISEMEDELAAVDETIDSVRAQAAAHGAKVLTDTAKTEIEMLVRRFDYNDHEGIRP